MTGRTEAGERRVESNPLICALTVASLTFLFAVGFPWQHHNESLVWAVDLPKLSVWGSLLPHPVTHVSSYRPLGIALAWTTFELSGGGIWLQQLLNLAMTLSAWLLALRGAGDRRGFAWLAFLCGGLFFSGYIYLFHLHGVFYGPLLIFSAWLLNQDEQLMKLTRASVVRLLLVAIVAALFHTFAFLLLAAFLAGRCAQDLAQHRHPDLVAVAYGILMSGGGILLLMYGAGSVGADYALQGWVASYRLLEVSPVIGLAAAPLAVLTAITLQQRRQRVVCAVLAVLGSLVLAVLHLPVLLAWIGMCLLKSLLRLRLGLAALIAVTAVLPLATGTGSPTYALFVLLPACRATIDGLQRERAMSTTERRLAQAALVALLLAYIQVVSLGSPRLDRAVVPLLAEKEKTAQMMDMLTWLAANPRVSGDLQLCRPADYPVHSGAEAAMERRYRAPTDAFSFAYYLRARYGDRLISGPPLLLCFGGQRIPGATSEQMIPGRWAGDAHLERP